MDVFDLAKCLFFTGAPSRIRTCDLRIRSPLLYPVELWAPVPKLTSSVLEREIFLLSYFLHSRDQQSWK